MAVKANTVSAVPKQLRVFQCARCGFETPRGGPNQKVCAPCKPLAAIERAAKWVKENPERARATSKEWRSRNVEKLRLAKQQYAFENADRVREYKNGWAKANPEMRAASKHRAYRIAISTPHGRLDWLMRSAVRRKIRAGTKVGSHTFGLLGYSIEELKTHLERQFSGAMSWSNYGHGSGKWHIDHILPLSSFSYETPEDPDFRAAWALTNLRPLWQRENLAKGAKITHLL